MIEEIPQWLQEGRLVDAKDRDGSWQVGLIVLADKDKVRIRFDGWPSKYDEFFALSSLRLRPFRSIIRGYTGQRKNPGTREHYHVSLEVMKKKTFQFEQFTKNFPKQTPDSITQFIRGNHYIWVDYLHTRSYKTIQEIREVFYYFSRHVEFNARYLADMSTVQPVQNWFNLEDDSHRAYSESHFEIFDATFSIFGLQPRLKGFEKLNQALVKEFIAPYKTIIEYWRNHSTQINFVSIFQNLLLKLLTSNSSIPINFIRSLIHLYAGVEKIIESKEKKFLLAQNLSTIIIRQCEKEKNIERVVQNDENDLQDIYNQIKLVYYKYKSKELLLQSLQRVRLKAWKQLILTESLDKKQKGINKIKEFSEVLVSQKKEFVMIQMKVEQFKTWLDEQKLLTLIFCLNEHQEIIKRGCELSEHLYHHELIGFQELNLIWNACRQKLDSIRKVLYSFFEKIIVTTRENDLSPCIDLVLKHEITQEIDLKFIYAISREIVFTDEKNQGAQKLLTFLYKRLKQNHKQIKQFAALLTLCDTKSLILSKFVILFFKNIEEGKDVLFNLKIINKVYQGADVKILNIQDDSMSVITTEIQRTLSDKTEEKEEIVILLLKMIENLEQQFVLEKEIIHRIWSLFSKQQNESLQHLFYRWILQTQSSGFVKSLSYQINKCLSIEVKEDIFENILKNSRNIDYINMKEIQFDIFRQFMIDINIKEQNINLFQGKFEGVKIFRIKKTQINGMRELWNIFLNCKNQQVIEKTVYFLKELHLNYYPSVSDKQKLERSENLLIRLQKNLKDGIRRSNMKLLKHSLILIREILFTLKQHSAIGYHFANSHKVSFKKKICLKTKNSTQQLEIPIITPVFNLKKHISKKYSIPLQNLYLESAHQIFRQYNILPLYSLKLENDTIKIREVENCIYDFIIKYIQNNLVDYLTKALSEDHSSHEAYSILTEIPQTKQPGDIIKNLMNFNTDSKQMKIILRDQSIYFRMYMLANVNRLSDSMFLEISSSEFFSQIKQFLKEPINHQIQTKLVLEALHIFFKAWKLQSIKEISDKNISLVLQCVSHSLAFMNKKKQSSPTSSEKRLLRDCFQYVLMIYEGQSIDAFVSFHLFESIMNQVFCQNKYHENQEILCEFFQKTIYLMRQNKISFKAETQNILYEVIFHKIYPQILKKEHDTENKILFFRIMELCIKEFKKGTIRKLFEGENNFWKTVYCILKSESDPKKPDERNTIFEGHLQITSALVYKKPGILTKELKNFIFYDCLFFDEEHTKLKEVKCKNKYSIQFALNIVLLICESSKEDARVYMTKLIMFLRTSYWRTHEFWNVDVEAEAKSPTGFVGLQNPGCICYLNSFMQMLYMNKEFRQRIINSNVIEEDGKNYQLLEKMKYLFLNLKWSEKRYISPEDFSRSIRTFDQKPLIKIFQQMDIDEFGSILFDKLESLLPKQNNFVNELFGGIYSNEIISQDCNHISEREEKFLSIRLDVKKSIHESFKFLIKGQTLQGQNAYFCQRCSKKVKAIKRQSIKKLPHYLHISLKRFQYNYELDQKIKLNNYCQFPLSLSLEQFSQQFLNKEQEDEIHEIHPKEYFEYDLKGVVIHTGFVDSGHYYALMEGENQKWFEFNDSFVTEFDIKKLQEEAFGTDESYENKVKNAYLLIYERKNSQTKDMVIEENHQKTTEYLQNKKTLEKINLQNKNIEKFHILFSKTYFQFNHSLMKKLLNIPDPDFQFLTQFFLEYCLLIRIRMINYEEAAHTLLHLQGLILEKSSHNTSFYYLFTQFCCESMIKQFFIECAYTERKLILSRFFVSIIEKKFSQVQGTEEEKYLIPLLMELCSLLLNACLNIKNANNEVLFILRKTLQLSPIIVQFFARVDSMNIIFDITTQTDCKDDELKLKEKSLKNLTLKLKSEYMIRQNDEQKILEIDQSSFNVLSSPMYKRQNKNKSQHFYRTNQEQGWKILSNLFDWCTHQSQLQDQFASQTKQKIQIRFEKLSLEKQKQLIEKCTTGKSANAIAEFIIRISKNNIERTERVMNILRKAFKELQSTRFRSFLILLTKIAQVEDDIKFERMSMIIQTLRDSLQANIDYFPEIDILHQWILKMASWNKKFRKDIEGTEFIDQIIGQVQMKKLSLPSTDLLKKQKNSNFSRLIYKLDGLFASSNIDQYQELCRKKNNLYEALLQKKYTEEEEMNEWDGASDYRIGTVLQFYCHYGWIKCKVVKNLYGILSIKLLHQNFDQQLKVLQTEQKLRISLKGKPDISFSQMEIQ